MSDFSNEPTAELQNPQGIFSLDDLSMRVEGEIVPITDVHLGTNQSIYFEHHVLLWKAPNVKLGFKSLKGGAKRFFAGLQIFISEAHGPGNIAFSRESDGQLVVLTLNNDQSVDVREHQFLLATSNIDYGFFFQKGLANIFFSNSGGLFIDRFVGKSNGGLLVLHGYGNVFEKNLAVGEVIDVEPGAWFWKDSSVKMDTVTALQSGGGGGIMGAIGAAVGGSSLILNRFTGPGRLGLQSMTYHSPVAEGATRKGGSGGFSIMSFIGLGCAGIVVIFLAIVGISIFAGNNTKSPSPQTTQSSSSNNN